MANSMANAPAAINNMANTYRYRDAEKRREYQRNLMRKKRAAGRSLRAGDEGDEAKA